MVEWQVEHPVCKNQKYTSTTSRRKQGENLTRTYLEQLMIVVAFTAAKACSYSSDSELLK